MRAREVDPGELEGDALDRWYRRTPDEIEADRELARQLSYDAFFKRERRLQDASDDAALADRSLVYEQVGPKRWRARDATDAGAARFQEVRLTLPPAPAPVPSGLQVGPPVDAMGQAPAGTGPGFFRDVAPTPNPLFGPAYVSELPSPLNYVQPRPDGGFTLGDGRVVRSGTEVERIYAEQKRRMRGVDESRARPFANSRNRFADGTIPKPDQLAPRDREDDLTCSPYGGWERDPNFSEYPEWSQKYQTQITRAPGVDYVVRRPGQNAVKFDGCAVWDPVHPLLAAKGPGYDNLLRSALRYEFLGSMHEGVEDQADRQNKAAAGHLVEWHIAEPGAKPFFDEVVAPYSSIRTQTTLPR